MVRFLAILLVVLFAVSATGAAEFVTQDVCSADCTEDSGCSACQPNCHCCGCCIQAVVLNQTGPSGFLVRVSFPLPLRTIGQPDGLVGKILHVPKTLL